MRLTSVVRDVTLLAVDRRDVLRTLVQCHAHGVVHLDVKPGNFLFRDRTRSRLKVIDFGLAVYCETDQVLTDVGYDSTPWCAIIGCTTDCGDDVIPEVILRVGGRNRRGWFRPHVTDLVQPQV